MREIVCHLCGSYGYRVIYRMKSRNDIHNSRLVYNITEDNLNFGESKIVRCLRCSLVYLAPKPDVKLLSESYAKMQDSLYLSEENCRRRSARLLLNKISRYKNKGRLLDIGCAAGILLDEAKKLGWEVYGVELSSWGIEYAKDKFGINVFQGSLEETSFPDDYFDAIVMADSIEHFPDPKDCLNEAGRILKVGGVICVSTPDAGSVLSRVMGRAWWGIKQSHLFYFNKNTISRILNDTGFKILGFSSHTRFFSLNYLAPKFVPFCGIKSGIKRILDKFPFIASIIVRINFGDQLEVYAGKIK